MGILKKEVIIQFKSAAQFQKVRYLEYVVSI